VICEADTRLFCAGAEFGLMDSLIHAAANQPQEAFDDSASGRVWANNSHREHLRKSLPDKFLRRRVMRWAVVSWPRAARTISAKKR